MLVTERKYEQGYKPHVCTISCTFFYIKRKDMDRYNRLKMANRHREKDKYVNEIFVYEVLSVIDCSNEIPTQKMKEALAKRIWRMYGIKGDIREYNTNIMNIKVIMNHGRVNYDFDETIH